VIRKLCPDIGVPKAGGLLDLMRALELAQPVIDELPALNRVLRRTRSLGHAAATSRDPAAALAYLRAADQGIQVDDFGFDRARCQRQPAEQPVQRADRMMS